MYKETFPIWKTPNRTSKGFSQNAFPIKVLPKDDRTDSFQEERLGLPYWTMILAFCVVVDESKCLDTPIWEFSIICEHLPFLLGYTLVFFGLLPALTVRFQRRTPGRTPFHPGAVLPRPASRTHPLPATPFQCPRSRTATLG